MTDRDGPRARLRRLLDVSEDYYRDGFRLDRPDEPESLGADAGRPGASEGANAAPVSGSGEGPDSLERIAAEVASCARCALGRQRRTPVPGEGAPAPQVLAIGEGPGAEEDATGRPFVGAAGQYLDKWLAAIGLDRQGSCYIANVLKCRPPGNRDPQPDEIEACRGYLARQVDLLRPRVILALGRFAAQTLTGSTQGVGALRGQELEHRGIPVVATYHPSAVLRDSTLRQTVWDDLKRLKTLLGDG